MHKYEVTKTINLTVHSGSQVFITDSQYNLAKNCLKIIDEPTTHEQLTKNQKKSSTK